MLEKHLDQARRQGGGFQGGSLKVPFQPSEDFIHCLAIHFKLTTICKWSQHSHWQSLEVWIISRFSHFNVLYEYFAVKMFTGIHHCMQQEWHVLFYTVIVYLCIVHWYTSALGLYWEWCSYPLSFSLSSNRISDGSIHRLRELIKRAKYLNRL